MMAGLLQRFHRVLWQHRRSLSLRGWVTALWMELAVVAVAQTVFVFLLVYLPHPLLLVPLSPPTFSRSSHSHTRHTHTYSLHSMSLILSLSGLTWSSIYVHLTRVQAEPVETAPVKCFLHREREVGEWIRTVEEINH